MNWNQIETGWEHLKGSMQHQWAKLTDDDLNVVAGKREVLAGKIQETYGVNKEDAEKQVDEWQSNQNNVDDEIDDNELDSDDSVRSNKFDYDDNPLSNSDQNNSGNTPRSMQDGTGNAGGDSQGPGDGAGIPGDDESDEMDDSGNPNPNPMPDDLDEPPRAYDNETPHQEKSLDQT